MSDSASTKSVIAVRDVYTVLGRRDEVVELLTATQDRVRSEPGCLAYTPATSAWRTRASQ
jgi:quinol monooxygenase YgiN